MKDINAMEMRQIYCDSLIKYAKKDKRIIVLEADLMMSTGTAPFAKAYPKRLIDCGIAEANMVGVAAGLASSGKIPFIHSFTPFVTRRCYDQIAVSVGYAKQNVKIVGTDPGIMATANGGTHMSFEDISLMMHVPDMVVFEPVDATMLDKAMPQIITCEKPMYIRLFRKKAKPVFDNRLKFDLFKAEEVQYGKDITIIASGIMVHRAMEAAMELRKYGYYATVICVHTYKPLDEETIIKAAERTGAVLTCENSHLIGGLGQTIGNLLMTKGFRIPFGSIGIGDRYGEIGTEDYLAEIFGLTTKDILRKAIELCKKKVIFDLQ